MKIAVDAFGGDNAPLEVIKGCAMAVKEHGVSVILCGDEEKILLTAKENNISLENIEISHTTDVINVEDDPAEIMRSHKDCSLARALKLVAQGEADAFVSAGSTGAIVYGASLIIKRIKGIKRAAIATVIPSDTGAFMLIDSGANVICRPEMFAQFGLMGHAYMHGILKVQSPRVGLLNIGAEETKGHDLEVEANQLMKTCPYNFIGNVEPRDIPMGVCDVVVTDGFSGNIVLKLTEGLAKMFMTNIKKVFLKSLKTKIAALLVKDSIGEFKSKMSYKEYGGAPLLGVAKPVIKAHGSSDATAFKNAIRQAKEYIQADVIKIITDGISELKENSQEEE
jgi:glycerol-3-phosphate acyltransferase PlsX